MFVPPIGWLLHGGGLPLSFSPAPISAGVGIIVLALVVGGALALMAGRACLTP